jgi:hypothetical protein
LIGKVSFAQIKFSLDVAPRLVLQFTAPIEIINSRPLGGDQQAFYFVVTLANGEAKMARTKQSKHCALTLGDSFS